VELTDNEGDMSLTGRELT